VTPLPRATSRYDLIKRLRKLGWQGPRSGGKHQFMVKGSAKLRIPNPHSKDIGRSLLGELLRQAGITADEWDDEGNSQ
jgi:predicted RNA binding protein YcfA (HicA-like mRNA interferase family)